MRNIILILSDQLQATVSSVLTDVRAQIASVLPGVEVHHIGATAIPGALTKGDLDVVIRVEAADFPAAIARLRTVFAVKQPENWDPYFASFGHDTAYDLPLGVQLAVIDSEADFFLFVRDYLIAHPDSLAAYNHAKQQAAGLTPKEYWAAKDRILAQIIALKPSAAHQAWQSQ